MSFRVGGETSVKLKVGAIALKLWFTKGHKKKKGHQARQPQVGRKAGLPQNDRRPPQDVSQYDGDTNVKVSIETLTPFKLLKKGERNKRNILSSLKEEGSKRITCWRRVCGKTK